MESNTVVLGPQVPNAVVCSETPLEVSSRRRIDPREFEQILQRAAEVLKLRAIRQQASPE